MFLTTSFEPPSCGLTSWKLTINPGECLSTSYSIHLLPLESQNQKKKNIRVSNNITKKEKRRHRILVKKVTACINDCVGLDHSLRQVSHAVIDRRAGLFGRVPPLLATVSSWPPLPSTIVMFFSRCLNGRTRRLRDSSVIRVMSWIVIACCMM